ncbi:geraniol 8-hydroxylase-like [Senna tora]|uniref:Geraniol 8-hydroxylase-like n=1 Tax=Senna tora TaxID=362788 RepID=A0A835CLN2_9FABA|nr:geraniol 8-hydroxylase-like [Senna tora]
MWVCAARKVKLWILGIMEEVGRPNVVDFFPILDLLDPQRVRARMKGYAGKLIEFLDGIIDERLRLGASEIMESKGAMMCWIP